MRVNKNRTRYYFGNFIITKRELIASLFILFFMIFIGNLISNKIVERQLDKNEIYNKALKIQDAESFKYGMETNIGNAFVYGDLRAVDTVTFEEIGDPYMYIKKVKEVYTRHTRTVSYTENGKTKTKTEVYWTWDEVSSKTLRCEEISFLGITFDSSKISMPYSSYIKTISGGFNTRYKYYGTEAQHIGTMFTRLSDNTISDNSSFYSNKGINETVEYLESGAGVFIFWFFWVIATGGLIFGFCYVDNNWLD